MCVDVNTYLHVYVDVNTYLHVHVDVNMLLYIAIWRLGLFLSSFFTHFSFSFFDHKVIRVSSKLCIFILFL